MKVSTAQPNTQFRQFKQSSSSQKIRFNHRKNKDFVSEVRGRVDDYFKENDLSPQANAGMVAKTVILFAVTYGAYFLIMFAGLPGWMCLALCALMGLGYSGIGFNVGHDALHGAYADNPKVNRWLGYSFLLIGANDYMWKIKHNMKHHTYTNIIDHDDDIAVTKLLRFSPNTPWRPIHRFQHLLVFIGYALQSLAMIFVVDFVKLSAYNGHGSPSSHVKHPRKEIIKLFATKAFYVGYMIVLPMLVLPFAWWQVLLGFLVTHVFLGFTIGTVFQLAHLVEETEHPLPDAEGFIDNTWAIHQMQTTSNFDTGNRFLTWFLGGLNFQVEHHLFPNICSVHYSAINPIVMATAREYGVPYHEQRTFFTAEASHFRLLKRLGRG